MKWNNKRLGAMPKKFKGHVAYESDRILQPQEVAKMIDMAPSLRDKAVIKFLHESAQRAGVLTALKYGDIRKQLEAREKATNIPSKSPEFTYTSG